MKYTTLFYCFILTLYVGCSKYSQTLSITTTVTDSLIVFSYGNNTFSISAKTGGRIVSYTCNGKELLIPSSIHSQNYGATLWTSPQSGWGWPPYPVLDTAPYDFIMKKDTVILSSLPDTVSGYRFEKKFYVNPKDTSINITYSIINISHEQKQVAAWDVCRIPGGFSFFPVDKMTTTLPLSNLKGTFIKEGILWYTFNPDSILQPQKLFSAAKGGWSAHVCDGMIFIKTFPDVSLTDLPPEQGEVEIFAQEEGAYIELENHGPYRLLEPGDTLYYYQKWYLKEISGSFNQKSLLRLVQNKLTLIPNLRKYKNKLKL